MLLPKNLLHKKKTSENISSKDLKYFDTIKMNFYPILLTYILKSIFSKKNIILISDLAFLQEYIQKFFEYITQDAFLFDITILPKEKYNRNKKTYKEYMVFKDSEIIRNVDKFINSKDLKVEKKIIYRFVSELDLEKSIITLKKDIKKAFDISEYVINLIKLYQNSGQKEKLGKSKLINMLSQSFSIKLSIPYLDFILNIIKNYFQFDISVVSENIFPALGI